MRISGRWRGIARVAFALLALTAVLAGCGKSGHGAETDSEKGSDADFLNTALAREMAAVDAYAHGQARLKGRLAVLGRRLLGQEQEYVDAITKAIRGLGGEVEVKPLNLQLPEKGGPAAYLTAVYELESEALAACIEATPRLYTAAPRTLAASLAAGHAQHLVVLRQGLGAGLAESFPEAFDGGEVPVPGDQTGRAME